MEKDLLGGRPVLRIAPEYGLAESSLRRHCNRHLAPALARREEIDADTLVSWLTGLQDKTLLALAKAERGGTGVLSADSSGRGGRT
jgi:hypothetical protein